MRFFKSVLKCHGIPTCIKKAINNFPTSLKHICAISFNIFFANFCVQNNSIIPVRKVITLLQIFQVNAIKEDEAALQKEYSDIMHQQWEINQKMLRKQATTEADAITYSNGNPQQENQQ